MQLDALHDAMTLAVLLVIGGILVNPGPNQNLRNQLQIMTKNARGLIEAQKKKLFIKQQVLLVNKQKKVNIN